MPTLLLRLAGPMQSWGTTSRFNQRDTGKEPSKSGVIGLVAASLGIDRDNWNDLEPLTKLAMGVRHDRPGVLKRDYQTAGAATTDTIIKAEGKPSKDGVTSQRQYLADAVFLVGLSGEGLDLLERAHSSLRNPRWTLYLGRKSYVPSLPVWLEDGLKQSSLQDALTHHPWLSAPRWRETRPSRLLLSIESRRESGILRMDQPIAAFSERRFGSRYVQSEWIQVPQEEHDATE